ncbi:TetR/AcrR family transcriptional regulator [Pseudaestuariivita atlantica]|uniref:HTH tetR-type domain-containing protein n=1 Tax=Pseudaestuariivita atlantica TaxID=1317121 RepID=A0A0L1JQU0_9RHOB|nr:TetR/AcrR family transcriptional regulator [Pseudaestuariivita atlantica]KNG93778.1 hypothetical protein ATO11_11415 [Pseudaestuariivita atlantica]
MSSSEKEILDAALQMFSRYGVRRTSMGDLAKTAGISRQTLYNAFRNKDDILRALIRAFTDDAIRGIEAEIGTVKNLGDALDIVFDKMVLAGFDLVLDTPNAQDLVDGFNASGQEEMTRAAERFRDVIERILIPHEAALKEAGLTPVALSDFIQRSAKAASNTARDREHLARQLETLKRLCLATVDA